VGPNGAGKSTLLRSIVGERAPDAGEIRLPESVRIAYYSQDLAQVPQDRTLYQIIADLRPSWGRGPIQGHLGRFGFSGDSVQRRAGSLSGGETARVALAMMMLSGANFLIFDEPTNHLDVESIEALEDAIESFGGTVLLVSHDREFLNNVVTSTIVFETDGVKEYDGGYDDWVRQRGAARVAEVAEASKPAPKVEAAKPQAAKKLGFKEKRELETLPKTIEKLESQLAALHAKMAEPAFYKSTPDVIAKVQAENGALQSQLDTAYQRWEELEGTGD
jgi:ATPase subunit of ABC transporter with duplicated ATPase domains